MKKLPALFLVLATCTNSLAVDSQMRSPADSRPKRNARKSEAPANEVKQPTQSTNQSTSKVESIAVNESSSPEEIKKAAQASKDQDAERLKNALKLYLDEKTEPNERFVNAVNAIVRVLFLQGDSRQNYLDNIRLMRAYPGMDGDLGIELVVRLQTVWEQRYGPMIRSALKEPGWGRERLLPIGAILGYATAIGYNRSRVGMVHRLVSKMIPYLGLGGAWLVASRNFDPRDVKTVPPAPFDVFEFGKIRPEEARWNPADTMAWNILEFMAGTTALPFGAHYTNLAVAKFRSKFVTKQGCTDAARFIFDQVELETAAKRFFKDYWHAGGASIRYLVATVRRAQADRVGLDEAWRLANSAHLEKMRAIWDYQIVNYFKNAGYAATAGGIAAFLLLQTNLDNLSVRLSNEGLREEIMKSQQRLKDFKNAGNVKELLKEGYQYRVLVEHYADALMIERIERSEEQFWEAIFGNQSSDPAMDELVKINASIRKTYTDRQWQIFTARIETFLHALKNFPQMQIPELYREVLIDGLPEDPANALLYGAAILHQNGIMEQFDRIQEKIAIVRSVYTSSRAEAEGLEQNPQEGKE